MSLFMNKLMYSKLLVLIHKCNESIPEYTNDCIHKYMNVILNIFIIN